MSAYICFPLGRDTDLPGSTFAAEILNWLSIIYTENKVCPLGNCSVDSSFLSVTGTFQVLVTIVTELPPHQ